MLLATEAAVSIVHLGSSTRRHSPPAPCCAVPAKRRRPGHRHMHTVLAAHKSKNAKPGRGFGAKQRVERQTPDDLTLWQQLLTANGPCLEKHTEARPHQPAALSVLLSAEKSSPFVGPVNLQNVEGCGRGLVATCDIQQGDVLLIANALVLIHGPAGQTLPPSKLVPQLMQQLQTVHVQQTAQQAQQRSPATDASVLQGWFKAFWVLYGGKGQVNQISGNVPIDLLQLAAVEPISLNKSSLPSRTHTVGPNVVSAGQQLHPQPTNPPAPLQGGNSSRQQAPAAHTLSRTQLRALQHAASQRAQLNGYGEAYQDVVLATMAQQPFMSFAGIWPAMAMVNHSCSPNACVVLTAAGQLVVRAATDIAAGMQVTISYAGGHAGSPVSVRLRALRDGFGFLCQCDRCLVEQVYEDEPVGKAAMVMHKKVEGTLRPQLLAALESRDRSMTHRIHTQLTQLAHEYKVAVQSVLDEEDHPVLQCASLPVVLELISLCQKFSSLGPAIEAAESGLQLQLGLERLQLVQRVAPGSYAHAQLAAVTLLQVLRQGQTAPAELVQQCLQAHLARYGPIHDLDMLSKALHAHEQNTLADDIADAQVAAIKELNR